MKAVKITIKVLVILLTSIWGLIFGLFVPLMMRSDEYFEVMHGILLFWVIMSIVGYFVPCFLVMLNLSKTAAGFSLVGTALALYLHSLITPYFTGSFMYLPQMFMSIFTILYVFAINPQYFQKRRDRDNAPAQSVLEKRDL
ncbi:MAG: hypothetical protein FWH20_01490 [Oscillospiraceae bacterium]|nr:hypothetical protein [Oscillospiraceae bacterium]